MKTSKALTLLTALAVSAGTNFIAPAQAYEGSFTKNSLSTENLSETVQLAQARLYRPINEPFYRERYESVQQLLYRIEWRADRFAYNLDSELDRTRLDGTRREDNINEYVRDFKEATNRLRDRVYRGQRVATDVQEVLSRASRIDTFLRRHRLDERTKREWANLNQDLDELARLTNVVRRF
jgi:hypothetical protein